MQDLIYKCDRCRKIIPNSEIANYKKRNARIYDNEGIEYDICSDCFESLEKWFDREPENEKAGE